MVSRRKLVRGLKKGAKKGVSWIKKGWHKTQTLRDLNAFMPTPTNVLGLIFRPKHYKRIAKRLTDKVDKKFKIRPKHQRSAPKHIVRGKKKK